MLRYLQLERSRGDAVPGEPGGDGAREAGAVHVTRGDVPATGTNRPWERQRATWPSAASRTYSVRWGIRPEDSAIAMNSSGGTLPRSGCTQRTRASRAHDLSVEADLRLVVQMHFIGFEGTAQIAQQTEPVGGVRVALGLVDLDARTVPLRLVHRHVSPPQQPFGVQGVIGEDGDSGAGLQDEGEAVEVEGGAERGDQAAGDPGRGRRGVGDGQ
ncbi:hypothetical protein SPURM210S_06654 [Streptomyces purpurascens]